MTDLPKIIENRIAEIDKMNDPEKAALAAQELWNILQDARTKTTPLRVKTLRTLRDARKKRAEETSGSSNQALADFLGVKVTGVNVLLRGGSSVMPKYQRVVKK